MGVGLWLPLKKGYEDNYDSVIIQAPLGDSGASVDSEADEVVHTLASYFAPLLNSKKKQTWYNCSAPGSRFHEESRNVQILRYETARQVSASIPGYRDDAYVLFCNTLYALLLHIDDSGNFHLALVVREGAPAFAKGNLWSQACRIWEHLQKERHSLFRRDTAYTMRQAVFSVMPLPGSKVKTKPI